MNSSLFILHSSFKNMYLCFYLIKIFCNLEYLFTLYNKCLRATYGFVRTTGNGYP